MTDRTITIDLSAPTQVADLPVLARKIFEWWVGELLALMPAWAKAYFPKPAEAALLFVQGDTWRIARPDADGPGIELDAAANDQDIVDRILQAAPDFGLSRLTLVLPRESVLRRRVELPLMADANLRSAVELQIDRLSPFKSDAARFAVHVIERDAVEGKLAADVAIAPRSVVEPIERRLTSLGFTPVAVDVATANGERAGFDLRHAARAVTSSRNTLINAAFVCGAAVMWYLAFYAYDAAREREIAGWQTRVAELRPVALRSAEQRRLLDSMIEPFAIARKHQAGLMLTPLAELTKLLPDTARLTEVRIVGDTIEMTGLALDAPSLIPKLEASKLFKEVKFRSPVTRRPELGKDRFEIAMKLEGVPAR